MTSFLELSCQSSLLVCYEKREPVMEEEEMVFEITLRVKHIFALGAL